VVSESLLDARYWIVPRAERLTALMADLRPAEALAAWWAETEELFTATWAAEKRAEQTGPSAAAESPQKPSRLSMECLTGQGLSIRQAAVQAGLSEAQAVGLLLNPRCQGNASRYCDCDDDIRRGALHHQSQAALARKHAISRHAVARLATLATPKGTPDGQ